MLPINAPKCPFKDNHVDGSMHFRTGSRASREVNYFPSSIDKSVREANAYPHEAEVVSGKKVRENAPLFDDFVQAGDRWRSFDSARQQRFADRVALTLSGERITLELEQIWLGYWDNVDPALGAMIREYDPLPSLPSLPFPYFSPFFCSLLIFLSLSLDPFRHSSSARWCCSRIAFPRRNCPLLSKPSSRGC